MRQLRDRQQRIPDGVEEAITQPVGFPIVATGGAQHFAPRNGQHGELHAFRRFLKSFLAASTAESASDRSSLLST